MARRSCQGIGSEVKRSGESGQSVGLISRCGAALAPCFSALGHRKNFINVIPKKAECRGVD